MGSRYRYNPRIESNEWRLLSLVYENGQNNWSIFEDRIKIND
jgi:hypothetical protein